jgi:omega-6 fatty acid desaturase (delta-12 desaturase)
MTVVTSPSALSLFTADSAQTLSKYRKPSYVRSMTQILTTIIPYGLVWVLMWQSLGISYWLTLALAVLQAGLTIRLFVIHHDCSHGSFFKSRRLNDIVGFVFGAIALTPYRSWQWSHAHHHASNGNLDRRGHGDVMTLTVEEYRRLSPLRRLGYRIFRNPVVMFLIVPALLFIVVYRFPNARRGKGARGWSGVMPTNFALAAGFLGIGWLIGWQVLLMLALPVILISTSMGVWLFYVQHQFEDSYWQYGDAWERIPACLRGSSYYALPRVFEWFTAHIGFHHIHHLDSRIPNYRLKECYRNEPALQNVQRLTIAQSLRCIFAKLWDEEQQRMVGFPRTARKAKRLPSDQPIGASTCAERAGR